MYLDLHLHVLDWNQAQIAMHRQFGPGSSLHDSIGIHVHVLDQQIGGQIADIDDNLERELRTLKINLK